MTRVSGSDIHIVCVSYESRSLPCWLMQTRDLVMILFWWRQRDVLVEGVMLTHVKPGGSSNRWDVGHDLECKHGHYVGMMPVAVLVYHLWQGIRAPLDRGLCTLTVPSLALVTILYLYILRRMISKNRRSVHIFVPINGVSKGPFMGIRVYWSRNGESRHWIENCNGNQILFHNPGDWPGIRRQKNYI